MIDTVLSASDVVGEVALCYDSEIWTANRTYSNTERAKIERPETSVLCEGTSPRREQSVLSRLKVDCIFMGNMASKELGKQRAQYEWTEIIRGRQTFCTNLGAAGREIETKKERHKNILYKFKIQTLIIFMMIITKQFWPFYITTTCIFTISCIFCIPNFQSFCRPH